MNQDYSNIYNYYEALVKTAFASHKYATTYVKYQDKQQQQQKHQAKVVVHNNKNDVEFEISDDFLEFYRESLKYKKEKSIYNTSTYTTSLKHTNKLKNSHCL